MFNCYILNSYVYPPLFNSLYSSMVERNTVNILINVRFILKACINYRGQFIPTIVAKVKYVYINYLYNYNDFKLLIVYSVVLFQTILQIIIVDCIYYNYL